MIAAVLAAAIVSSGARPAAAAPTISEARFIRTSPFVGTSTSPSDAEGLAYVPRDNSIWLSDDNSHTLWEIDKDSGALKRSISQSDLAKAPRVGGGGTAGSRAASDLEALAYDEADDVMYAFSGTCCPTGSFPSAVFKLVRSGGKFVVDSYRPFSGSPDDFSGVGFVNGQLWLGSSKNLYTFDYDSGNRSLLATVSGVNGAIDGISDGPVPWVVSAGNHLYRLDADSKQVVSGYDFDLTGLEILDPRAVEVVGNQLIVADGYDSRSNNDPLRYAIHFLNVGDGTVLAPSASFLASPSSGTVPLDVQFADTSSGNPTGWLWDFGDGTGSSSRNPSHTFTGVGSYTVTLTASNNGGSTSTTTVISVRPPAPTSSFTTGVSSGSAPLTVAFTDTSTGNPTTWSWDFGDGSTSTSQNPSHVFTQPGQYTVALIASNSSGTGSTAFAPVTVIVPKPVASFTANANSGTAPLPVNFTDTSTSDPTAWAWDFGDGSPIEEETPTPNHTFLTAGTYRVTLTASNLGGSSTSSMVVTVSAPPPPPPPTTGGTGGTGGTTSVPVFRPLDPRRLLDTRLLGTTDDGQFQRLGVLEPGQRLALQVSGRGGVPAGAGAVALNVTAVDARGAGYLTVWPCDTLEPPLSSNLNYRPSQTVANLVIVPLDATGRACVQTSQAGADVLADVSGYFPSGPGYVPLSPRRMLDTRLGNTTFDGQYAGIGIRPADTSFSMQVTGRGLVPAGAEAVVLNVTVTGASGNGYATVWPCDHAEPPNASNLNFGAGQDVPNLVVVPLSPTGTICLQSSRADAHLLADVAGYFPLGSAYTGLTPQRLLDSRAGGQTIDGRFLDLPSLAGGEAVELAVAGRADVPSGAIAAVLNVTSSGGSGSGYVTVWPCEDRAAPAPNVSTVNFTTVDIANAVIAPLTSRGTVCLQSRDGSTQLIADVSGYFTG